MGNGNGSAIADNDVRRCSGRKWGMEERVPRSDVMCADALESMYHSLVGGGVRDMVLKLFSSCCWSKADGGVE